MKYKASELTGALLDAAVAKALYVDKAKATLEILSSGLIADGFLPSTSWAHGGPIVEAKLIEIVPEETVDGNTVWRAKKHDKFGVFLPGHVGATPLEAAMRCVVFMKIGAEVDL